MIFFDCNIWLFVECIVTGDTPCPLFQDEEIIQQPADFLTLAEAYSTAATGFIHQMAGMYACILLVHRDVGRRGFKSSRKLWTKKRTI